jgi:hypothetical protein
VQNSSPELQVEVATLVENIYVYTNSKNIKVEQRHTLFFFLTTSCIYFFSQRCVSFLVQLFLNVIYILLY